MKKNKINKKIYIFIVFIIVIGIICILGLNKTETEIYEVIDNKTEIYTETKGYVLFNETVIDYDNNLSIVPIAESEKRVSKNESIAVYKTDNYDKSLIELKEIDEKINEKVKLLPEIYSTEVTVIEKEIEDVLNEIGSTSSLINFHNYKEKLDKLAYEKIQVLSKLSPSGEEIQKLLEERETFNNNLEKLGNNIASNVNGIVLYKIDNLENRFNNIEYNENNFENIIQEYDKEREESSGIKIVDNYKANIFIKIENDMDNYIELNKIYDIILTSDNTKIKGKLVDKISNEFYNYLVFEINNKIESFISSRKVDLKIVWDNIEGFSIPKDSVRYINDIMYVTWFVSMDYVDVPVKKIYELDNSYIVNNYTTEERNLLNLDNAYYIELYDRIIVNKEN